MTTTDSRLDQPSGDNQYWRVEAGQDTPAAIVTTTPITDSPPGPDSLADQDSHVAQRVNVSEGQDTPATNVDPLPDVVVSPGSDSLADRSPTDAQLTRVGEGQTPPSAREKPIPNRAVPVVDPLLFVHATAHHDLEQQRVASENRLRILTTTEPDEDGTMRGFGLDINHPDVARLAGITDALRGLENDAKLGLCRSLRRSSLHSWIKAQVGLGEKQVARLLAAIGDPYWHLAEDRPRTVSELWAYSGLHVVPANDQQVPDFHDPSVAGGVRPFHVLPTDDHQASDTPDPSVVSGVQTGDPDQPPRSNDAHATTVGVAAKRRKGVRANWSTEAKTRAYLCATSCIKQAASPYRSTYVARRAHTAETHSEWTPGHSHNDALRIASKAILRDLWREAKRLHETPYAPAAASSTFAAAG